MNQTRAFLIFAWLMVATLLWMEWGREQNAPTIAPTVAADGAVPVPTAAGVPAVPTAPGTATAVAGPGRATPVTVTTDVLSVVLDGGELGQADLLRYPRTKDDGSAPVRLFDQDPANFFIAQSGWVSGTGPAPSHEGGFAPQGAARRYALAPGQNEVTVPFVWTGPNGVTIRRTYTFRRGDYAVQVRDEVVNRGAAPWQGYVYRQLSRVPRALENSGPMNAAGYSFQGAAWYSAEDKYEKRDYEDFVEDGTLNKQVIGGWIAMLQHHFFAAWIPQSDATTTFSLATPRGSAGTEYLIRTLGPAVTVAPGGAAATQARLWVGPKLISGIQAQQVPGLERAVDFSRFGWLAALGDGLFWLLEKIHALSGNWGWAIVGLVVVIKLVLYPLSAAQYRSMAKMRKFQPRIAQLKERFGDDKQGFQVAMMDLYRKEKINPVGGCLPLLIQMPVFLALYWVLLESVELRQAPWIGWINDLTARDPFFVLPALNMAIMWFTQKLTPAVGMDPMQQKMMQFMPLVFGVMFAFFPAGLVLYWVTNAGLGLLQQWWMTRRYAEPPSKAATVAK
ncbi:membrane protein insertase YidC [Cognatilysobacter bugurensis]|uniref:Membrane protein insertase YidC n=1 Tax=Cognatilysobacter bugurensis TaxID=543356 RepID=A0A918W8R9_9GAMM|nr:membrane protein insertase YidC [Lysobacter bugurensis]GHA86951.1 membrane protein insertase YidC [Lysobacter bugurensis]